MRFHLHDKFKFMRMYIKWNAARPQKKQMEQNYYYYLWKSHFQYRAKEHPTVVAVAVAAAAASGDKNAWTVMLGICAYFSDSCSFAFNIWALWCVIFVCVLCVCVRSCRMYNSYQIHFTVAVVIRRKFIRIWFDEQARWNFIGSFLCFDNRKYGRGR